MAVRYALTCDCGRVHPVETSQAGVEIKCECGATLKIPSMLKIKRLPEWQDVPEETSKTESIAPSGPTEQVVAKTIDNSAQLSAISAKKAARLSARRWGLLIFGALIVVVAAFLFARNVKTPTPLAVFYKQQMYVIDGKAIRRDSSPVERSDFDFYFLHDPYYEQTFRIDDDLIDGMTPFYAYAYFDTLKSLDMSDNFYDNYESIKARRIIRLVSYSIAMLVGLGIALFALFAPESKKSVGTMRGSDWR
ncbi:MAG: hypothetical protein HUK22_07820 [Thermoguttaceae bacterium]|nr:hypothetical protein [Thermoguttaceae bacterium]